jgi:hypothetical protein
MNSNAEFLRCSACAKRTKQFFKDYQVLSTHKVGRWTCSVCGCVNFGEEEPLWEIHRRVKPLKRGV